MRYEYKNSPTIFTQQTHLSDYLNIIVRHKWVVIIFFLTVVSIVTIKTYRTTRIYKATAQIIIEKESSFMDEMEEVKFLDTQGMTYYETQSELLKSRSLASKVIENMRLREYLANRPQKKPSFLTLAKNRVRNLVKTSLFPSGRNASETRSNKFIEQGKGKGSEYVPKKRDWRVSWYLSNLVIEPIRETNLVKISFLGQSPEIVARIANAHANAFIERNNQVQHLASQQAIDWLKEQLRGQKNKVGTSQQTLNKYKYEQLKSFSINEENLFSLPEIKENSVIQEFRMKLAKLKIQKIEMVTKFGHKHPKIIEISSSIEKTKQEIVNEVHRIRMSIKAEIDPASIIEKSIQKTQDMQQVGVPFSEKAKHYDMLQLEAESDQEIYDILLKQAKEIDLTGNMAGRNIRIIDEAVIPNNPVEPKVFLNIFLSVVMGLAFGLGFAFFLEYMCKTEMTPEEVMQHLGMSVIGILPYDTSLKRTDTLALPLNESHHKQKKRKKYYAKYNVSASLLTSLPLRQSRKSGQVFIVESATAGEGKSTVLAKTALSMAKGGLRVVMLDADLQRPALHNIFGLKNDEKGGLINITKRILSHEILQGSLDKYSLDDLFSLIALRKQSGSLFVKDGTQAMTAVFDKGHLFHLQSKDIPLNNRLGSILLRGGFITESQLKDALERNKRTDQPLGYILINSGYINQDILRGPLKLQMEEYIHKLFSWKQGTFVFEPGNIETYEDKRIYFQEDYSPIINRLGRIAGSRFLENEILSYVKSVDEPNLALFPSGIENENVEGPIYYTLLAKILDILKQHYEVVLIDAPPVLETMGSVKALINLAEGIILVVKSGHVSLRKLKDATQYLKECEAKIIGVMLNQVKIGGGYYYKTYYK